MNRIHARRTSVLVMVALTAACGRNAEAIEDRSGSAARAEAMRGSAAPAKDNAAWASRETLPLRPGAYVRAGTPCDRASRADTLALVSRTGMSLNCTFQNIEQTGPTTYRVTSQCSDGGAAWGRADEITTSTEVYEIPNETSFNVTREDGSESSARHCAQVSAL